VIFYHNAYLFWRLFVKIRSLFFLFFAFLFAACQSATPPVAPTAVVDPTAVAEPTTAPEPQVLRLATTTSTADSGLLDAILPDFEAKYNARVDVVAVGTGQAIELGVAGDADVILVHARAREDAFVTDGHGTERLDVMYNDFILVGPKDDPAGVRGMATAAEALTAIAGAEAVFASRGDDSGTHSKEKSLWEAASITPDPNGAWYKSLGQGMGETLTFANESGAYTLTDRGTFLAQQANLPNLEVLVGGASIAENQDSKLLNPYGVIPVNPDKGNINNALAVQFAEWLTSLEVQQMIANFGVDTFGQPLFYPDSEAWRNK
jgi:tungstate transport system substrate-binding protein